MTFCRLLIAAHCYWKILPMREGSKTYFVKNKHEFVETLFLILIVYIDISSNLT